MGYTVQSIDHVEVFVRSIPDAIRWYEKVLGLRETARWDPEPVMVGVGGTQLALFQARRGVDSAETHEPPPLRWHRVAWKTDRAGLDTAMAHLASLGISFRGPVDHDPTVSIYFQDPDGNPLEITCSSD